MCGICGLVTRDGTLDARAVTAAMNAALAHRGPDHQGEFHAPGVSLAMSRLAIIDVAGGNQPLFSDDRRLAVVFNGEIYNFAELRAELEGRGHHFHTRSDTEVLLHGYLAWGDGLPLRLKGMFAFCIHDARDGSLFLARDRFGEKPLYYHHAPGRLFAFASELRSLLLCPAIPRQADPEALGYYLRVGLIPEPLTGLRAVRSLRPGHWLRLAGATLTETPYFELDYRPDPALADERDAVAAVEAALETAVRRQMISDVPLGAFLSGGIDSSAIVATMQRLASRPVKTFTVRFEHAAYDESAVAAATARHLGTEHHEIVVPNVAFDASHLWRIVDHVGMPFYDTSAIPTYLLSAEVRKHVTVALSGDGGDEMFAGYPFFRWGLAVGRLRQVPAPARRLGAALVQRAGALPGLAGLGAMRKVRRALDAAAVPAAMMPVEIHTMFRPEELVGLVADPAARAVAAGDLPRMSSLPPRAAGWTPLRRLMYYRMTQNLVSDMLVKVDRMSMACSLEVRAPMLDVDLAALAARLPDRHLIRAGRGKHVLREVIRPRVPAAVLGQPKSGFSIPLHAYQNRAYEELAAELLGPRSRLAAVLEPAAVAAVMARGLGRKADRADASVFRTSHQLWSLMMLSAWAERFAVSLAP